MPLIQSSVNPNFQRKYITRTVTDTSNGVQITFSISNPQILTAFVQRINNFDLVQTTFALTTNGITITRTSKDTTVVQMLQAGIVPEF